MSIAPPSDIVLDVARAADPTRYQVAAERLSRLSSAAPAEAFSETLELVASAPRPASSPALCGSVSKADPKAAAAKTYQAFEAMTLSTFIESAMPDDSTTFGSGTAGSVWKSMLSEQIANQMAKSGGIGIAKVLERHALAAVKGPEAGDVAPSVLSNAERGFLRAIAPDDEKIDKTST